MLRVLAKLKLLQQFIGGSSLAVIEPMLHASPGRLWFMGSAFFIGNPLYYWIWSSWLKQPYENIWLRGLMSLLGLCMITKPITQNVNHKRTRAVLCLMMWVELPLFFSWMYLCNGGSEAWLGTICAMIVIYYHLTDWRIATVGLVSGGLVAWSFFEWLMPHDAFWSNVDLVLILFSWSCALFQALSSASMRQEQLAQTLVTMGIMAHELRTPLSRATLIADAIQMEVVKLNAHPRAKNLDKLSQHLHALVGVMNHQIDTEIANARLLQLPSIKEEINAEKLVNEVIAAYPFGTERQRDCVEVVIHKSFIFSAGNSHFSQVLDNMIKNALHSLSAAESSHPKGAIRIEVSCNQPWGSIVVSDQGVGIKPTLLPHIFKPFVSSNGRTGHGLGLAFCQKVVERTGGKITVYSPAKGAAFTIELPVTHAC